MPPKVVGVSDVLKGLVKIDEDMRERIRYAIDPLMRGVALKAKSYVPNTGSVLSGWAKPLSSDVGYKSFPKYDADAARKGIGYNPGKNKITKNGFQVSQYVYNVSRPGSIYEVAGRLNPQGRAPFEFRTSYGEGNTYSKKSARSKALQAYNSNNPFASQQFIAALEPVTKQPKIKDVRASGRKTQGRLVYKAWAEDSIKVYQAIVNAINGTADNFNKSTEKKRAA